jgi:hypothetical protein
MLSSLFATFLHLTGLEPPQTLPINLPAPIAITSQQPATPTESKTHSTRPTRIEKRLILTQGLYDSWKLSFIGLLPALFVPSTSKYCGPALGLWFLSATSLVIGRIGALVCFSSLPQSVTSWYQSHTQFYQAAQHSASATSPAMTTPSPPVAPPEWHDIRENTQRQLKTRKGSALYYMGMFTPALCTGLMLLSFLGSIAYLVDLNYSLSDLAELLPKKLGRRFLHQKQSTLPITLNSELAVNTALSEAAQFYALPRLPQPSHSNTPISLLSSDIFQEILKHVDGHDLLHARRVAKSWYHQINAYLENPSYIAFHAQQMNDWFFSNLPLASTVAEGKLALQLSMPTQRDKIAKANLAALQMLCAPLGINSQTQLMAALEESSAIENALKFGYRHWHDTLSFIQLRLYDANLTLNLGFDTQENLSKIQQLQPFNTPLLSLAKKVKVLDLSCFCPMTLPDSNDPNPPVVQDPIIQFLNCCSLGFNPALKIDEVHLNLQTLNYPIYQRIFTNALKASGRNDVSPLTTNLLNALPGFHRIVLKIDINQSDVFNYLQWNSSILSCLNYFQKITLEFVNPSPNTDHFLHNPPDLRASFKTWLKIFPYKHITFKLGANAWPASEWATERILPAKPHFKSADFIVPQGHYEEYRKTFQSMRLTEPFTVQLSTLETPTVIETIEIPRIT